MTTLTIARLRTLHTVSRRVEKSGFRILTGTARHFVSEQEVSALLAFHVVERRRTAGEDIRLHDEMADLREDLERYYPIIETMLGTTPAKGYTLAVKELGRKIADLLLVTRLRRECGSMKTDQEAAIMAACREQLTEMGLVKPLAPVATDHT